MSLPGRGGVVRCLASLLAVSLPGGQEILIRPQKPLAHEVSVSLKLIQVHVTDKKGNPVPDLTREDFVLYADGRPVDITEFERHVLAPPSGPKPAAKPEAPPAAAPQTAAPSVSRKYILFFDFAYNNPRGVAKGKEAILHFLDEKLQPGDEVALFSYSLTRGLSVNEFLTLDHKKVREAVEALDVKDVAGRAEDVEQEYWLQATGQISLTSKLANDIPWLRLDSKKQAETYILKLTALAKGLRYVPGQKHLVLFSTGIPQSLIYGGSSGEARAGGGGEALASRTRSASPNELADRTLLERYDALFKELATANCEVFSFDTRAGPMVPTLFAVDEATFGDFRGAGRDNFTAGGVRQNQSTIFKEEKLTGLYTLTKLSKDTGGKYYGNIDEYERSLDQLRALTGTYYVLGYPVRQARDGAFHEIKVEVKRPGCQVRVPAGYFDPKPFSEYSDLERQLHLIDLALSKNPVFQAPARGAMIPLAAVPSEKAANLVLLTRLPVDAVERLSGGSTELVTMIFDEADKLVDLRRTEADLGKSVGQAVFFASEAALPSGSFECRLVARNLQTGEAAVASAKAFVPQPLEKGIRLYPPLLVVPGTEAAYLEGRVKGSAETQAEAA
ncbi:MAG: VWA domain-containing protein, partial [Candidatus Aminicenantes bacterium]|nr:VWA domain-containing protein [Candidatus Aminicenantes bacterium]